MNRYLEDIRSKLHIAVETGTLDVKLFGDTISGTWPTFPRLMQFGSPRPIAVELLNMGLRSNPNPLEILKFRKRFGPLTLSYSPDQTFQFSIHDWRSRVAE